MSKVMDRLLEMRNRYLLENLPLPKEVQLSESEVYELVQEYMQYSAPSVTSELKVLGFKIIKV